jgi:hypothetical protein
MSWLQVALTLRAVGYANNGLSVVRCSHISERNVYSEQLLETRVLYVFNDGRYDWIVCTKGIISE